MYPLYNNNHGYKMACPAAWVTNLSIPDIVRLSLHEKEEGKKNTEQASVIIIMTKLL